MFTFEQFPVYIQTERLILHLQPILKDKVVSSYSRSQLYRASMSILLNIAEGAGKFNKLDKRKFYSIARGSTQECVAVIRLLRIETNISEEKYQYLYTILTDISKMLSGLMNKMTQ